MSIQLAPDIEAGLRTAAAARGMAVDTPIVTTVRSYLREAPALPTSRQAPCRDRSAEMAWAASPDAQCLGKWVVMEGSEVVASGSNLKQLYEDVRAKGFSSPFLIFVSPDEDEPFAGGWIGSWFNSKRVHTSVNAARISACATSTCTNSNTLTLLYVTDCKLAELDQDVADYFAVDIRQTEIAACIAISQLGVVDAKLIQHGRVQIVNRYALIHGFETELVGFAV
jgi:hypothetical protein